MAPLAHTVSPVKPLFGDVQDLLDRLGLRPSGECRAGATRLRWLTASLLRDLVRFGSQERADATIELLEVLAAAIRHGRALRLQLQQGDRQAELTVFPNGGVVHLAGEFAALVPELAAWRVVHIEPAQLTPVDDPVRHAPLGPLLWQLALRGARHALLPEIDGYAAYRVAPSSALDGLAMTPAQAAAVARLKAQTVPLHKIARWPGMDRQRVSRLLNGLYLQSALIVSRSHPSAVKGARNQALDAARRIEAAHA